MLLGMSYMASLWSQWPGITSLPQWQMDLPRKVQKSVCSIASYLGLLSDAQILCSQNLIKIPLKSSLAVSRYQLQSTSCATGIQLNALKSAYQKISHPLPIMPPMQTILWISLTQCGFLYLHIVSRYMEGQSMFCCHNMSTLVIILPII